MITSETKVVHYWMQRRLESLTREELLEAATWMAKELARLGASQRVANSGKPSLGELVKRFADIPEISGRV